MEQNFEAGVVIPDTQRFAEISGEIATKVSVEAVPSQVNSNADSTPLEPLSHDAEDWQDQANCLGVDPDLFFPERGASTREAKEVCRGCIARLACLEYALQNGEKFGIWGGLSERERRRIRRQRSQSARSARNG